MKKKMGRPRLSRESAKDVLVGARFGEEEVEELATAFRNSGQIKSEWLRERLNAVARYENKSRSKNPAKHWTKTHLKYGELSFQTVEFELTFGDCMWSGIGELWVRRNHDGKLAIEVVTEEPGHRHQEKVQRHFQLDQACVDRIDLHPDQKIARLRLG